jgi:hypothetical protein
MAKEEEKGALDNLQETARDYLNLRIDDYKLRGVENLSLLFNKIIFTIIAVVLGGVAVQLLALALGYLIGELIGSVAAGFFIMGIVVAVALFILYLKRDKLFISQLIKLFIKLFFDNEKYNK